MNKKIIASAAALLGVATLGVSAGSVSAQENEQEEKVTICHVAGRADDPANYITLTIGYNAVYGPGGHLNEDGTTQAGHEQDDFGACDVDVVPDGDLEVMVAIPTLVPPTCLAAGSITTPDVEGLVFTQTTGEGGSITVSVEAEDGYVLMGDTTSWTFTGAELAQLEIDNPVCTQSGGPIIDDDDDVIIDDGGIVGSDGGVTQVGSDGGVASQAMPRQALPATGVSNWTLALLGLASLMSGVGLVSLNRRQA